MRTTPSSRRAAVACALAGVLVAQLVVAGAGGPPRRGAAMAEHGPHATPHHGHAGAAGAGRLLAADPDADSSRMPCDGEGACDWGLMRCDGTGSCVPIQVAPAAGFRSGEVTASRPPAVPSIRAPASLPLEVDRPPPRT